MISDKVNEVTELNANLTHKNNELIEGSEAKEKDLLTANNQITSLNNQIQSYEDKIATLTSQAKSAAEGDPTTFRLVQGGSPVYPLRFFQGVGQLIDENGNPVDE